MHNAESRDLLDGDPPDSDLLDQIKEALDDLSTTPWLPGLAATLVARAQDTLRRNTGIEDTDYGTARVLACMLRSPSGTTDSSFGATLGNAGKRLAPRLVMASIPLCPTATDVLPMLIEVLPKDKERTYRVRGLEFHTSDAIDRPAVLGCLREAVDLLHCVPTLQFTVASLVRVCHLVKPGNDDYDISYSDPQLPFSIFVSVPRRRQPNGSLRVIESIVHEAMHLQLTLIERALPLVSGSESVHFSPWRNEQRPTRGLLHALYVFRVIDRFLQELQEHCSQLVSERSHIASRRKEICRQFAEIGVFQDSPSLTPWGSAFARRLIVP